jgi:predicted phosphoribosyltransferase
MFADRTDAGMRLANVLMERKGQPVVVYALPRGGVAVAAPIARGLEAPLDLIVVRKIGHPESPEYAVGAVSEDGDVVLNPSEAAVLDMAWVDTAAAAELHETHRQRDLFLEGSRRVSAAGRIAIVVDDGLATGLTMEAAIARVKKQNPAQVIIAVPVAAAETADRLRAKVDEIVVLHTSSAFRAVGLYYGNFNQLGDNDVVALLRSCSLHG